MGFAGDRAPPDQCGQARVAQVPQAADQLRRVQGHAAGGETKQRFETPVKNGVCWGGENCGSLSPPHPRARTVPCAVYRATLWGKNGRDSSFHFKMVFREGRNSTKRQNSSAAHKGVSAAVGFCSWSRPSLKLVLRGAELYSFPDLILRYVFPPFHPIGCYCPLFSTSHLTSSKGSRLYCWCFSITEK